MVIPIVLASASSIRTQMLRNANVDFDVIVPRVDEEALKQAMLKNKAGPRDIADALADMKARKISARRPDAWVIGCDQILDFQGRLISKPTSPRQARERLGQMRGQRHDLFSAAVIYRHNQPVWRQVGQVRLRMHPVSDGYLDGYVKRNWEEIRHSAGAYLIEGEGVRLFAAIEGDYFNVLGMPLLEILNFLAQQGVIAQ